jgi:hypothetical protein
MIAFRPFVGEWNRRSSGWFQALSPARIAREICESLATDREQSTGRPSSGMEGVDVKWLD